MQLTINDAILQSKISRANIPKNRKVFNEGNLRWILRNVHLADMKLSDKKQIADGVKDYLKRLNIYKEMDLK